jgi:hypothetical protein
MWWPEASTVLMRQRSVPMNGFVLNLALICSFADSPREANDPTTVVVPPKRINRIGQIWIVGNKRTKMNVILGQLDLYPGQLFDASNIRQAQKNVMKLGIFKNVSIKLLDGPLGRESEFKDITIHVEERQQRSHDSHGRRRLAQLLGK